MIQDGAGDGCEKEFIDALVRILNGDTEAAKEDICIQILKVSFYMLRTKIYMFQKHNLFGNTARVLEPLRGVWSHVATYVCRRCGGEERKIVHSFERFLILWDNKVVKI